MAIPRPSTPRAAWSDLKAFVGSQEKHKIGLAIVSIMMPAIMVFGFYLDSRTDPPGPQIIYAQNWRADRSDAVIEKQNIADQKILDAKRAEKQREYKRLADKLGIE